MSTATARTALRPAPPRRAAKPVPATEDAPPFPKHTVAAEDIPSRLPAILKQAQHHAIGIQKNGKPVAVLLAADLFQETMEQVEKDDILAAFLREIAYEKNASPNAEAPNIPNAEARMRSWNAAADDLPPHVLDMAQRNPVRIERGGKPVAVLVSRHEYACLTRLEDIYWGARAEAAEAKGDYMSAEESEAFLREMMNAPD